MLRVLGELVVVVVAAAVVVVVAVVTVCMLLLLRSLPLPLPVVAAGCDWWVVWLVSCPTPHVVHSTSLISTLYHQCCTSHYDAYHHYQCYPAILHAGVKGWRLAINKEPELPIQSQTIREEMAQTQAPDFEPILELEVGIECA